jgi:5-(carboxyamino)imidazole ribonucleotide synthase
LGNTDSKVAGIMVNLVGAEGYSEVTLFTKTSKNIRLGLPHIYEKNNALSEKWGMLPLLIPTLKEARRIAEDVKTQLK